MRSHQYRPYAARTHAALLGMLRGTFEQTGNSAMTYDPEIHHRRSIRLSHYDYAQAGAYFVTICTQARECA